MKRTLNILIFLFFGLISLYASLRALSLIDLHKIFPHRIYNSCWEIDHCLIPSWYWLLAGIFLALPILAFIYFGIFLHAGAILKLETAKKIVQLFSATMIFQAVGGVIIFFIKTM